MLGIDEIHIERFSGRVGFSGQHHLGRLRVADPSWQALADPPDRLQRPLAMGIGKTAILTGEKQVAAKGELQRAGITVTVHGSDNGLWQVTELFDHLRARGDEPRVALNTHTRSQATSLLFGIRSHATPREQGLEPLANYRR